MKQFTLKALAAAASLVVAGAANAAADFSELGFYASNDAAGSVFFDLGVLKSEFTTAATSTPGLTITWDLNAGTVTSNTPGSTTGFDYGSVWSGFSFNSATRWGVIASDGNAGDILSTSSSSDALTLSTNGLGSAAAAVVGDGYYPQINITGTHVSAANGASSNTGLSSDVWYNTFFAADKWGNQTPFVSGLQGSGSMPFWSISYVDDLTAIKAKYDGIWTLNAAAGTLTYSVAPLAEVPEPSAYALVVAGIAGLGSLVRRRKSK